MSKKVGQQNSVIRVGVHTAPDEVESQCPVGVGRVELLQTLKLLHCFSVCERTVSVEKDEGDTTNSPNRSLKRTIGSSQEIFRRDVDICATEG